MCRVHAKEASWAGQDIFWTTSSDLSNKSCYTLVWSVDRTKLHSPNVQSGLWPDDMYQYIKLFDGHLLGVQDVGLGASRAYHQPAEYPCDLDLERNVVNLRSFEKNRVLFGKPFRPLTFLKVP